MPSQAHIEMTHTKPLRAGQPFRMVFTFTAGSEGVAVGGAVC